MEKCKLKPPPLPNRAVVWAANGLITAASVSMWWLSTKLDNIDNPALWLACMTGWFSFLGAYGLNLFSDRRFINDVLAFMKLDTVVTRDMLKHIEQLQAENIELQKRLNAKE